MFYITILGNQSQRLSVQNFFAYRRSAQEILSISKEENLAPDSLNFEILHGEWWSYTRGLVQHYFEYFSPSVLFINGDYSPRNRVADLGSLYYFSVILIPLGLLYLLKSKKNNLIIFIFAWLLLSPIPAVLSRDLISDLRALNIVVPFSVLEGTGLYYLFLKFKEIKFGSIFIGLFCLLILGNFLIFVDSYFVHSPKLYSKFWLYGYKQTFQYLNTIDLSQYQKVVFSDYLGQPYIYYLFYTKYDPVKFQKQAILDQPTVDVGTVRKIDNIEFRSIFWPGDRGDKNSLYIGNTEELPDIDIFPQFKVLNQVVFLDGQLAFRVVETNK
jgi:hypothetical protein